jgi:homoserine kinase type II
MAVYTDITDEELDGLLSEYDLGKATAFKGIAEGVSNSNFLLETERGRFILTVYERRFVESELPYFMALLDHLAERGFPGATPVHARDGSPLKKVRGKPCAIISFLTGISARRPTAAHCREAGEGLAWLHMAGEGFTGRRANALGHDHWARMFHPLRQAAEDLKPGLADTIEGDLAAFAAGWPRGLPEGTIHADFFPDNVFFQDGRFSGAFDFYFACYDQLAYDVAVALNAWCFEADGSFNLTSARAFIQGYEKRRTLSVEERAALPMLAHGAAMRFFLTRLADWGSTPEGALVRPKDPLEYERKLAVHRSGLSLMGEMA